MTTEERLESLERGLSAAKLRNKYLLIGLVILAIAWAFTSTTGTVQAQAGENIIQAESFELVDSQGTVRAALVVHDDEPGLALYDENGTVRAALGMSEFGPVLGLADENGNLRATLGVSDELGPGLYLYDEIGNVRAGLDVRELGSWLYLYDEIGNVRAGLSVIELGSGLYLYDENETLRAGLGVSDEFGPGLDLCDENGRLIWSAP